MRLVGKEIIGQSRPIPAPVCYGGTGTGFRAEPVLIRFPSPLPAGANLPAHRKTEQSVYNTLEDRGYIIRIWPARYPKQDHKYGHRLSPLIRTAIEKGSVTGQTTEPSRFTDEDLQERELSYGRSGFALQFMLDTSLSDQEKHPLKLSDLIVYPCDPYRAPIDFMWAGSSELSSQASQGTAITPLCGSRRTVRRTRRTSCSSTPAAEVRTRPPTRLSSCSTAGSSAWPLAAT
jgi:hypothetical protein